MNEENKKCAYCGTGVVQCVACEIGEPHYQCLKCRRIVITQPTPNQEDIDKTISSILNEGKWEFNQEGKEKCKHCGGDLKVRNPKGFCDHLYYPEYCKTCSTPESRGDWREKLLELAKSPKYMTLASISMKTGEYSLREEVVKVIEEALTLAHTEGIEEVLEAIKKQLVREIAIAQVEGQPTSRLTSLAMFLSSLEEPKDK